MTDKPDMRGSLMTDIAAKVAPQETVEGCLHTIAESVLDWQSQQRSAIADELTDALDNLLTVHRGATGPRVKPNAEEIAENVLSRYFSQPQQAQASNWPMLPEYSYPALFNDGPNPVPGIHEGMIPNVSVIKA